MVVQHNLTAMNSNRMLGLTSTTQAKSTEKLSSGYKINRAADDAAGLSISEKMRKQIRGLTQASLNAEDGISAVQTAEGALNEVQDMLQRMNELAVKAANGTMSENDRNYIQNEVDQLVTEIDRVSETTKFNETYLLKGDKAVTGYSLGYKTVQATNAVKAQVTMPTDAGANTAVKITVGFVALDENVTADAQNALAEVIENTGFKVSIAPGGSTETVTLDGYSIEDSNTVIKKNGVVLAAVLVEGGRNNDTAAALTDTIKATAVTPAIAGTAGGTAQYYDKDGNKIAANGLQNYFDVKVTNGTVTIEQKDDVAVYDATGNEVANAADSLDAAEMTGALTLKLHVGADATTNNQITIDIQEMSSVGLGLRANKTTGKLAVDGATDANALNAIDTIKEAIQKVSTQRSSLGAVQNRLEHTIANLDNVVENTTAAESQIRDTDMASEMVKYSNNNILAQAGQAMLAQANQSNQGVLSLLR